MAEHNLRAAAFPTLKPEQLAALAKCPNTKQRHFHDGEFLFEAGQRDYSFFIIKSGQVEIIDKTGDVPKTVVMHGPGQFTGEVAQLTGSPALVSGVARGECDVCEISPDALHQLLNRHLDLADVILQAFIARRQLLRESGEFMGMRVVGSRDSQDTFRVRDFLAKNRIPFTWIDLDSDPAVKQLLETFQLSEKDTPVVSWGTEVVLRNPSNIELANLLGLRRTLPKYFVRSGGGRRRTGRIGRGGVRRFGRFARGGAGARGPRRASRPQHAHRKLPGFSGRNQRQRSGRARRGAGQSVRRMFAGRHASRRADFQQRRRCSSRSMAMKVSTRSVC